MTERNKLPDDLRLGPVELAVSDLGRSIAWYEEALGLQVHSRDDDAGRAALGAGEADLVVLVEQPGAQPPGRSAGLYHYALLYPSRLELARTAQRLALRRTPVQGASDHGTHEAIYLPDPDGIGIELAADRPREEWPDIRSAAGYVGGPRPLDTDGLLEVVAGEQPVERTGPGLRMGHVHLHVGDVERALGFYRDLIGFEEMVNLGAAAFVSAGGYHHHLAFNVWRGQGRGPAPSDAAGLRHWTIVLSEPSELEAVRRRTEQAEIATQAAPGGFDVADPWGIVARFVTS